MTALPRLRWIVVALILAAQSGAAYGLLTNPRRAASPSNGARPFHTRAIEAGAGKGN